MARYKVHLQIGGDYEVSNCTNLNRVSNNKHCKYQRVVLGYFGQTNQLSNALNKHFAKSPIILSDSFTDEIFKQISKIDFSNFWILSQG